MPETQPDNSKRARNTTQSPTALSLLSLTIQQVALAPGVYLVATPIGNLRDVSLRALDILASADIIVAEDTRQSRKLLQAYGIDRPLSAYHDHNAAKRVPGLVKKIRDGASVALISDAGTPLISDPGYKLARAAIDSGIEVFAIPGASAVLNGLVSSGLASDKFMFAGFLPPKSAARRTALQRLSDVPASLIFFESAARLQASLTDMQAVFGGRSAAIAREMTKRYEEIIRGSLGELCENLEGKKLKGEIVVIVGPPSESEVWEWDAVDQALRARVSELGVKRASEEIASMSGHNKREVYSRALTIKDE